jgi:hypothetical protein
MWEYLWEVIAPGDYAILARATSSSGRVQPAEHDSLNGGYLIHHSRPVPVNVAASPLASDYAHEQTILYDMNAFAEENMRLPLDVELEFTGGGGI